MQPIFIFDYDGTLVEIANSPEAGLMPEAVKTLLNRLVARFPVAILTGRSLPNLKYAIGEGLSSEIILIGTHGAEPIDDILESPYQTDWQRWSQIFIDEEYLVHEPKALTYAIHFKLHPNPEEAMAKFYAAYRGELADSASFMDNFRVQEGIGVFELIPHQINKGMGIDYLHQRFPDGTLVFFGDDLTDNFAHARVNELGGISYQVGYRLSGDNRIAKNIIPGVADVHQYIAELL